MAAAVRLGACSLRLMARRYGHFGFAGGGSAIPVDILVWGGVTESMSDIVTPAVGANALIVFI